MTLTQYTSRIERAWLRYQLAKTDAWKDRWQFGYLAAVSAERAIKAVALVKDPPAIRAVTGGLRGEGESTVLPTSDTESTTTVGARLGVVV